MLLNIILMVPARLIMMIVWRMRKAFPLLGIQRVNKYLVTPAIAQVLKDSARGNEEGGISLLRGYRKGDRVGPSFGPSTACCIGPECEYNAAC